MLKIPEKALTTLLLAGIACGLYSTRANAEQQCFAADHDLPPSVDTDTGYRMQRYRAAVPDSLPGGCVVGDVEVARAHDENRWHFIDVYPPKGLGPDPLEGHWIVSEKHRNIQGSVWLPEVGRGFLEADYADYFRRNLESITHNDKNAALMFYCTSDCWQSWNAARRALLWGYTQVFWYPAGIDGWLEIDRPLVDAVAVNFLETQ